MEKTYWVYINCTIVLQVIILQGIMDASVFMAPRWWFGHDGGRITVRCYCGAYYDLEYKNLSRLENHLRHVLPDARFELVDCHPRLIVTGVSGQAPLQQIQRTIDKNKWFHGSKPRHPPMVERPRPKNH